MLLYICPKRIKPIFVPTAKYMLANNKRKVCDFLFSLVYCIFKCNNSHTTETLSNPYILKRNLASSIFFVSVRKYNPTLSPNIFFIFL